MAKVYNIPPSTSEEEKPIGGVLTFIQFFWLLGGAVLAVLLYTITYLITNITFISAFLAIIALFSGIPFAFYKKKEMTLFTYLRRKGKFKKKIKKLINRRYF